MSGRKRSKKKKKSSKTVTDDHQLVAEVERQLDGVNTVCTDQIVSDLDIISAVPSAHLGMKSEQDGTSLGHILQKRQVSFSRMQDVASAILEKTSVIEDYIFESTVKVPELHQRGQTFSQDVLDNALISACQLGHKFQVHMLVHLGADVQTKDINGNTPLMICAENGFTDIVRFLLRKKADVSSANSAGDTALIVSVRPAGSIEMMKVLLEQKGVVIHHQNKIGYTALMKALEVRDIDAMKLLLNAESEHSHDRDAHHALKRKQELINQAVNCKGETVPDIAERCGLTKIFQFLVEHMITGMSPLVLAAEACDLESFYILLNLQSLDAQNFLNEAFRHIFTKREKEEDKTFTDKEIIMIKKLLEHGADTKHGWYSRFSPLSISIEAGSYAVVEMLCEYGIEFDEDSYYGSDKSPLNLAAKYGRCDLVELLLKYSAKIDSYHFSGSALDCALIHSQTDCAKLLIQKGAKMVIKDALMSAVDHQNPEYMKFMFKNYSDEVENILLQKDFMVSLLAEATEQGNIEIIGQILDTGVDISCTDTSGVTPLVRSKNGEVAQFLISKGADIYQVIESEFGSVTPLIYILMRMKRYSTSDSCTQEIVKVVLENGGCVSARDPDGRTPLMLAAVVEGSENILQMLLDHGSDLTDRDSEGNTALILAVINGHPKNSLFLIQFNKSRQDFLNLQNNSGSTALICAVSTGNLSITQKLIDQGADVNIKNVDGNTALLCAVKNYFDNKEHTSVLIKAGCDFNCQNNDGLSPLMLAVKSCMKQSVTALLKSGADVNAVSQKDNTKTAISFLLNDLHFHPNTTACLELLLDHGANSSYVNTDTLHRVILHGDVTVIPKLIGQGLGPVDISSDDSSSTLRLPSAARDSSVSPLHMALLVGNVALARYFVEKMFLTVTDVTSLMYNKDVRCFLEKIQHQPCLDFLDEMSSQPMSLFSLAFVSVTSCLGAGPGREDRVNLLPLPQKIKERLLFKTEEVQLNTEKESKTFLPNYFIDDYTNRMMYNILAANPVQLGDIFYDREFSDNDDDDDYDYADYDDYGGNSSDSAYDPYYD